MLLNLFLGWADGASHVGASLAAMRYDEHASVGRTMATLLAFRVDRDQSRSVEAEFLSLRERLSEEQPSHQDPPHIEEVDMSIGRSLRVEAVCDFTTDGGEPQPPRFVLQHWIPLIERGYTLQFEATTNALQVAPEIAAEVDAIVASVVENN